MSLGATSEEYYGGWSTMDEEWRKGPWTTEEDRLLVEYVRFHGEGRWSSVACVTGLKRNGKSCRLRWVNYLRPDLKRSQITSDEEDIIVDLHARWGNRWSTIARCLPGRTDNEIKNYWRTKFKKNNAKRSVKNTVERSKFCFLRKPQFQQTQQQQQLKNELDVKRTMSLIEVVESEQNGVSSIMVQARQMISTMCPNIIEEQCLSYGMFSVEGVEAAEGLKEGIFLDGLWSLDDAQESPSLAI